MRGSRKQGQHPDDEEVVRDHRFHFGESDGLDSDPGYDLLIAEGEE